MHHRVQAFAAVVTFAACCRANDLAFVVYNGKYFAVVVFFHNNGYLCGKDIIKKRKILSKIDNTRFSQPTRHHWRGASRDLLLQVLSILKTGKRNSLF